MDANFSDLEKQCDYCNGEGVVDDAPCVVCKGGRMVLTELGERMVDLIDRRINLRLRQA
jgi:DnaJ-class molecular chaperone